MIGRHPVRRPGRQDGEFGQSWLLTFADLIALLLTFFIMLYATQRIGNGDFQALMQSLSQSLNPAREFAPREPAAESNIRQRAQARGIDLGYLQALLADAIAQEPALAGARLQRLDDRLVIALPADLLFAPGEAAPVAAAARAVTELAAVLRNVANRVDIYGHSDPEPVSDGRFASNWELSLARARRVAAMLRDAGYVRRVAAYGLADSRIGELAAVEPRARRWQLARRVDIVVRQARERH